LEEEDESGDDAARATVGCDGNKAFQTAIGHGIEHAKEKPLHQETHQIPPR
jgi:hypothetical protein